MVDQETETLRDGNYEDVNISAINTSAFLRFFYFGTFTSILLLFYVYLNKWDRATKSNMFIKLTRPIFLICVLVFMVLNTIFNWTVGSYIYKEFPIFEGVDRSFFTTRTQWYIDHEPEDSWKRELAELTATLLNRYDPDHVK